VSPELVAGLSTNFADPNSYPVEARGLTYSFVYFSPKHAGAGQYYLVTIKDRQGQSLDGGSTYRLSVPPNAPVTLYWLATAYDRETHGLIRNQPRASLSSVDPAVRKNADGSVDVYFGPKAPSGNESNWVPTSSGRGFEVMFRFYGPQTPLFDKTWTMPDIEKVAR
jgi:hypothetical protein